MDRTQLIKVLLPLLIAVASPNATLASPFETCVNVPADSPDAVVTVCESASKYTFKIADHIEAYDKKKYQALLTELTGDWLAGGGIDRNRLFSARVEIWMSVPEANPAAAKVRAFFRTTTDNFVISLPISPKEWRISNGNVGVTERQTYPQSFGYRAGSLLIKKAHQASESDFLAVIQPYSTSTVTNFAPEWYGMETAIFDEKRVSDDISGEHSAFVDSIQYNQIMEWMAWREQVFAFSVHSIP